MRIYVEKSELHVAVEEEAGQQVVGVDAVCHVLFCVVEVVFRIWHAGSEYWLEENGREEARLGAKLQVVHQIIPLKKTSE